MATRTKTKTKTTNASSRFRRSAPASAPRRRPTIPRSAGKQKKASSDRVGLIAQMRSILPGQKPQPKRANGLRGIVGGGLSGLGRSPRAPTPPPRRPAKRVAGAAAGAGLGAAGLAARRRMTKRQNGAGAEGDPLQSAGEPAPMPESPPPAA